MSTRPLCRDLIDYSGTITVDATAQVARAANPSRVYLFLQNISDTTMWVNFNVAAVADKPSMQIAAGGVLVFEGSFVPSGYVSVIGATATKKFVLKEA